MTVIYHGKWTLYKPQRPYKKFKGTDFNILYTRRDSDYRDWYVYINDDKPFKDGSVKMIVRDQGYGWVVGAAVYDESMLWPESALVVEVTDYQGNDPQKDFGGKVFNLNTRAFENPPPDEPPPDMMKVLNEIMARLSKLEERQ
jgi:hypothetical protein